MHYVDGRSVKHKYPPNQVPRVEDADKDRVRNWIAECKWIKGGKKKEEVEVDGR